MQTILAIDDSKSNLMLIEGIFKKYLPGVKLLKAISGEEGILIAEKKQPRLIILDILMPSMNGYEVCKILRQNEKTKTIPVILLTAINASIENKVKGLDAGAEVFQSKPTNPRELVAQVNTLFRIKKNEDELRKYSGLLKKKLDKSTKEFEKNEKQLRNIFENSINLFYSHTPEHILTFLSPQVEDILGYTKEKKWTELTSDNPINEIGFNNTVKAMETGKRQPSYELELVKKSGEKIWVEVREFPQVENGKTMEILGSLTDITGRKQAAKELKKYREHLEEIVKERTKNLNSVNRELLEEIKERKLTEKAIKQAEEKLKKSYLELKNTHEEMVQMKTMATLGEFSSGIAHEIRNPLANISASTQYIIKKFAPKQEMKEFLEIIDRNTANANFIIQKLLEFAKPRKLSLESINICNIIDNVCKLTNIRQMKNNIKLHKKYSKIIHKIMIDKEQIQLAILNIVINAIDAMQNGGRLSITTDTKDDNIVINISDTGEGIPKENIKKIFNPFFTSKSGGVGLGLPLTNSIIESHKGKIEVESKQAEGTKFTIKLPICQGEAKRRLVPSENK